MCSAASTVTASLPKRRFTRTVTQIGCSIPTLSRIRAWLRAAAEQLAGHFDKHGGDNREKARNEARSGQTKATQNTIGRNNQQSVAAQELQIDTCGHARFFRSCLRRRKPRQRIDSLLHPAVIDPREDCACGYSRACFEVPKNSRSDCRDCADGEREVLDTAFSSRVE